MRRVHRLGNLALHFEADQKRFEERRARRLLAFGDGQRASGRAVAGGIGTSDQVKVTVFGPVVNLASRLEGMTKLLHAPILLDEAAAEFVRFITTAEARTVFAAVGVQAPE